jgi:hypothetical protein
MTMNFMVPWLDQYLSYHGSRSTQTCRLPTMTLIVSYFTDRSDSSQRHPMKEVGFYTDGALKNLVSRISILDKLKSFTRKVHNF